MATRAIKDAKDLNTGEKIYFRGHAKATFMSDGRTVEEAIAGRTIKCVDTLPTTLSPNTLYVVNGNGDLTIEGFDTTDNVVDEYTVHFVGGSAITLPGYVKWANGVATESERGVLYELSVIRTNIANTDYFKAVLTPFK
jgi:hypothetical protein